MLEERLLSPRSILASAIFPVHVALSTGSYMSITNNLSGESSDSNQWGFIELPCLKDMTWFHNISEIFHSEFRLPPVDPLVFSARTTRPSEPYKTLYHRGILHDGQYPKGFGAHRARGDNFSNLLALFSDWNFRSSRDRISGEHPVVHSQFVGKVTTGVSASVLMRNSSNSYNRFSHTIALSTGSSLSPEFSFQDHYSYLPVSGYFDALSFPDISMSGTQSGILGWVGFAVNYVVSIDDWVVSLDPFNPSVAFTFKCTYEGSPSGNPKSKGDIEFRISVEPSISFSLPEDFVMDGVYSLYNWYSPSIRVVASCVKCDYADASTPTLTNFGSVYLSRFSPTPGSSDWKYAKYLQSWPRVDEYYDESYGIITGQSDSIKESATGVLGWLYNEPSSLPSSYKNKRLKSLTSYYEGELSDLYAGFVFSQNDAFDRSFEQLDVNMLETLSDMRDIGGMFSVFETFPAFLRRLSKGKTDFWSVLDLLTSQKLLFEFGVAPTIDDAKTIANKGLTIAARYKLGLRLPAFRGKFVYELDDSTTVTYRSKIVPKSLDSVLFASLLPVRAAGLLPNLQSIWNLVQYSFVADWFFNVDDRLQSIDTQSLLFLIDIDYIVSSIKIEHKIASNELDEYDIQLSSLDSPVVYRYFGRGLSDSPLPYGKTKYDFLEASGPSDLFTAASFFYKIVRGK